MKQTVIMALAATTLFLASCSKKSTTDIQPQTTDKVTVNGTDYATVKIGTQTWTAVNYNGTGGVNYNGGANDAATGKFYTITEAKAVVLPTGWRLPTSNDFTKLYTSQSSDAKKLMAKTTWTVGGGTNTSTFNAIAAGYYSNSAFDGKGTDAVFITTSTLPNTPSIPACFNIYQEAGTTTAIITDIVESATDKGSLRFVKDN